MIADAAKLFGGKSDAGFATEIDEEMIKSLLSDQNITDIYSRKLSFVALKRAAFEACAT
jgi:hypothetical protein